MPSILTVGYKVTETESSKKYTTKNTLRRDYLSISLKRQIVNMDWILKEECLIQSNREDLEEQLERQNEAHLKLLAEVQQEKGKLDEYRELLHQLQRRDRFFHPARDGERKRKRFQGTGQEENNDEEESKLELELENRFLRLEIEALESQIAQVEEDREHLLIKQNNTSISQQAEENTNEAQQDAHGENILEDITSLEQEILALEHDIQEQKVNQVTLQQDVDIEKQVVGEMNKRFLDILNPELQPSDDNDDHQIDVDQLILDSMELRRKYSGEQEAAAQSRSQIQNAKEAVRARRMKSLSSALKTEIPTKVYCYSDASRALNQVRLRLEAGEDCSSYLQKMVLGLLESLHMKDQLIVNQSMENRTLGTYLTKLSEQSPALSEDEERRLSMLMEDKKVKVSKVEDGGLQVSIEFEQPKTEPESGAVTRGIGATGTRRKSSCSSNRMI